MNEKYKDKRVNWDHYFIKIAHEVSTRSSDPKKQVGAIIVDNNNRIISTGYNGLPSKINENIFDWNDRYKVGQLIIHAECNALLYCSVLPGDNKELKLYSTLSPCGECLKLIKVYNINNVYYKEKYRNFDSVIEIANILDIKLIQLKIN